jgi:N-acetylmuramic acid 6-phosphate etherase
VTIAVLTGPEVVTGSTRMKAGTATKLVLNTITTGAMVRLGKTFGNLMVDLQAWNQKLVDRGERIVMAVTGIDREAARAAIYAAGGSVRTAIVMVRRSCSREDAEGLLREHDNHLRPILGDPPPIGPE